METKARQIIRLSRITIKKSMSYQEIADKVGCSKTLVYKVLKGEKQNGKNKSVVSVGSNNLNNSRAV